VLGALTVTYTFGTLFLPRHSTAVHAWADFGWLLMTVWAAVECWGARRKDATRRFAWIALAAANVAWMLAMIVWSYEELVRGDLSPFPTIADAGFIVYAPLYALGIFFLAGGTRSLALSLRHAADLGIAVSTMLFSTLVLYYRPSVELGLPPLQIATAVGYPVAFLSATAFGLLALFQGSAPSTRRALTLHVGALALLAFAYTVYGVEILTRRYETGHALDSLWFAGLALSIWGAREDRWNAVIEERTPVVSEPTWLDASLPAIATALLGLVIITRREDLRQVPVSLLALTCILFVGSLGLRGVAVMRLERELRRDIQARERDLLKAQKMEAVSTLASGLGHDFNNLLTGIMAATSLLRRRRISEDSAAKSLEIIEQCVVRATEITRRLRSLSHGARETARGVVDVTRAIQRVESLLRSSVSPAITLVASGSRDGARVWGNEGEIEQILLNLGLNAAHAMPSGGRLELSVEHRRRPSPSGGDDRFVVIKVRDEGCGIPESNRRKIFEPFFTTRARGEGTGLGLAMVYALVKEHGGEVQVHANDDGDGTTFEVELPETDRESPASDARDDSDWIVLARGTETVLVVDDRDAPLLAAKVTLEAAGYDVLVATRPAEALDIVTRRRDVALLLTDSVMPEMNGRQLVVELQKLGFTGPAIVMTADDEDATFASGPFTARVPKPFAADTLVRAVRGALDESRAPARRAAGPVSAA
jgi:signal transduction histidine kinase